MSDVFGKKSLATSKASLHWDHSTCVSSLTEAKLHLWAMYWYSWGAERAVDSTAVCAKTGTPKGGVWFDFWEHAWARSDTVT